MGDILTRRCVGHHIRGDACNPHDRTKPRAFAAPRLLVWDALTRPELLKRWLPERIVATEQFDQSWYPGGAIDTWTLVEKGGTTTLTTTLVYDSRAARDAVIKSPMESGVAAGYDTLDAVLADAAKGKK